MHAHGSALALPRTRSLPSCSGDRHTFGPTPAGPDKHDGNDVCMSGRAHCQRLDGPCEEGCSGGRQVKLPLDPGTRVDCRWRDGQMYPARVIERRPAANGIDHEYYMHYIKCVRPGAGGPGGRRLQRCSRVGRRRLARTVAVRCCEVVAQHHSMHEQVYCCVDEVRLLVIARPLSKVCGMLCWAPPLERCKCLLYASNYFGA